MMMMMMMTMIIEDMIYDVWCMDRAPDKCNNTLQDLMADAKGGPTAVLLDDNPFFTRI